MKFKKRKKTIFFLRASGQRAASEEACPCCLHPRLPLHPVLSQKIRVSAENPNFYDNFNLDRIFPFWPVSLSPYANHTSYSRLKTQGFTETLTLTTTLII